MTALDTEVAYLSGGLFLEQASPSPSRYWRLTSDRVTIGRAPSSDVFVEDTKVSRHHAHLIRHGPKWSIVDAGSANGIYINGRRVRETALRPGDRIGLGDVELVLRGADAQAAQSGSPGTERECPAGIGQNADPGPPGWRSTPDRPDAESARDGTGARGHADTQTVQGYYRAMRLYDQGRKEDARRILVQIVHARPYQVDALYALGVTSEDLGDTHAAADLYRRVIGLQPDHSPAARRLRQLDDARRAFPRQAARSDPYFAAGGVAGAADRPFEGTLAYRLGQGESASPGERRYRLRRALRTFFPAFIVAGLLSAAAAALKSVAAKNQWYSYETSGALRRVYDDGPNILLLLAVALVIWSLLRYVTTHYEIFDARVDVKKGVLFRRHRVLWLYEIDRRVEFRQSALQTLLATGSILIEADPLPLGRTNILGRLTCGMVSPRQTGRLELIGISTPGEMGRIAEELRSLALRERRAMLNWMMSR